MNVPASVEVPLKVAVEVLYVSQLGKVEVETVKTVVVATPELVLAVKLYEKC